MTKSVLYQELLKPQLLSLIEGIRYDIEQAKHLAGDDVETAAQRDIFETEQDYADRLLEAVQQDDYELAYTIANEQLQFARWPSSKKADPDEVKDKKALLKNLRDKYKKDFAALSAQYLNRPLAEQEEVLKGIHPYAEEMARVTKRFSEAYWERKLDDNVLDFNDLEHLTLQILAPIAEDGERKMSDASAYYRNKFQEVLIDEYQDVNQLQESILYWVTRHQPETENLFMVGDVKQSIYAFRLADPSLFLRKYAAFADKKRRGTDHSGGKLPFARRGHPFHEFHLRAADGRKSRPDGLRRSREAPGRQQVLPGERAQSDGTADLPFGERRQTARKPSRRRTISKPT